MKSLTWLAILLASATLILPRFSPRPHGATAQAAVPAVLLAPETALIVLAGLTTLVLAAKQSGDLSPEAADQLVSSIQHISAKIRAAEDRAWEGMKRSVVALYKKIRAELGPKPCAQCAAEAALRADQNLAIERARAQLMAKVQTQSASDAQAASRTHPDACYQYKDCCRGGYLQKFSKNVSGPNSRIRGSSLALRVLGGKKFNHELCCIEWDGAHGGMWEIFVNGKHMGERKCDDLSDDPCARTVLPASTKTEARSSGHDPRSVGCRR